MSDENKIVMALAPCGCQIVPGVDELVIIECAPYRHMPNRLCPNAQLLLEAAAEQGIETEVRQDRRAQS